MIKLLIAEDTAVLRRYLVQKLSKEADIEVVGSAGTGKEIFELAKTTDFNVAVLDIDMETPTAGIVAAGEILAIKPESKIIFLTVHEDDEIVLSALEVGTVDYVVKSDDVGGLLRHIRNFASGNLMLDNGVGDTMKRELQRRKKRANNLLYFIKNLSGLTAAEKALVLLLLEGKTARQIAEERVVELTTVKSQISHILKKVNASRTKELVDLIREMQLESLFLPIDNN